MPEELSVRGICGGHKEIVLATVERTEKRDTFILWQLWASTCKKSLRCKKLRKRQKKKKSFRFSAAGGFTFRRWWHDLSCWSAVTAQGKQPAGRICSPLKALGTLLRVSIGCGVMELPNVMHFTEASWDLLTLAWLSAGSSGTQWWENVAGFWLAVLSWGCWGPLWLCPWGR